MPLGLISWNEFSENSQIEPSQNYKSRSLEVLSEINHLSPPVIPEFDSSEPAVIYKEWFNGTRIVALRWSGYVDAFRISGSDCSSIKTLIHKEYRKVSASPILLVTLEVKMNTKRFLINVILILSIMLFPFVKVESSVKAAPLAASYLSEQFTHFRSLFCLSLHYYTGSKCQPYW